MASRTALPGARVARERISSLSQIEIRAIHVLTFTASATVASCFPCASGS